MKRYIILVLQTLLLLSACQNTETSHVDQLTNPKPLTKKVITTDQAPLPGGAFSQAIQVGQTIYLAGQIGKDPHSGKMVNDSLESEVRQVMHNLQAVLHAADSDFEHVVQTTIYLKNLDDFATVNRIYASYMGDTPPARATVEVSDLSRGAKLEIAMIALQP